jgi:hypothetical protein
MQTTHARSCQVVAGRVARQSASVGTLCAGACLIFASKGEKIARAPALRYDLTETGWLDWAHARQPARIQSTAKLSPGVGLLQNLVVKDLPTARGQRQLRRLCLRRTPAGRVYVARRQPRRESDRTWTDVGFRCVVIPLAVAASQR